MGKTIRNPEDLQAKLWRYWKVELAFRNRIYGGVPKSPEMIRAWLEAKLGVSLETDALVEKTVKEMKADVDQEEKKGWTGFKVNDDGLYIESRQVKAMIKEAAGVLREKLGISAFKARVAERVFVAALTIPLGRAEPDGAEERPIHVMTKEGPRTALKKADYVENCVLAFTLKVLDAPLTTTAAKNKVHPEAYLPLLLEWAEVGGLGADRSQGNGKFQVTRFEEVAE